MARMRRAVLSIGSGRGFVRSCTWLRSPLVFACVGVCIGMLWPWRPYEFGNSKNGGPTESCGELSAKNQLLTDEISALRAQQSTLRGKLQTANLDAAFLQGAPAASTVGELRARTRPRVCTRVGEDPDSTPTPHVACCDGLSEVAALSPFLPRGAELSGNARQGAGSCQHKRAPLCRACVCVFSPFERDEHARRESTLHPPGSRSTDKQPGQLPVCARVRAAVPGSCPPTAACAVGLTPSPTGQIKER